MRRHLFTSFVLLSLLAAARAQLAITEIVSSGSTNLGATRVTQRSDWWELSNFGTNTIDLTGYKWNDDSPALGSGAFAGGDALPFQNLIIGPGESVLFVETVAGVVTNEANVRSWWGTNLSTNVQIRLYTGNGLGSGGDTVRLWAPSATSDFDFVDAVTVGTALRGSSFTYNTNTGLFTDFFSTNGVNGAFKAVETDDVGSPGVHQGPVPLAISQQPTSLSVNPGDTATFTISVRGVPRAKIQWKFNGTDVPGATLSTLTVTNVQQSSTGVYSAFVFNGFQSQTSSNAVLTLNGAPAAPTILAPLSDATIYVNQNWTFAIVASGSPQPTYRWRLNDVAISGANGSSYTILNAALGTNTYSVIVSNSLGVLTNSATLRVTPRPNLVITEVQSSESTNGAFSGHNDWWELSNFDAFSVDLYGYRFDDNSLSRISAFTITNHIIIAPGESIVFVEGMSANSFRRWWGSANLPANLQITRYDGANLGFSSLGDALVLWNPGAVDDNDFIAGVPFAAATIGVSFGYNPDTQSFGDNSAIGVYGAFQAMESDDIGSPGYLRTPSEPRILRFARGATDYQLTWFGLNGRSFGVEYKDALTNGPWTQFTTVQSTGFVSTATINPGASASGRRFIRMSLLP